MTILIMNGASLGSRAPFALTTVSTLGQLDWANFNKSHCCLLVSS